MSSFNRLAQLKVGRLVLWRVLVVAGVVLAAIGLLGLLFSDGPGGFPLKCWFHELSGLHCPGCGMTRAADAMMQGEFAAALGFNVVGVILLPVALVALAIETVAWVTDAQMVRRLSFGRYTSRVIAVVFVVFFVFRNLPWFPFTLLQP